MPQSSVFKMFKAYAENQLNVKDDGFDQIQFAGAASVT